jgi:hypothetical protein
MLAAGPCCRPRRDADFFYFDADTSGEAEDDVIRAGAELFADLPVPVEIRYEAQVHLWYADRFGTPAPPFRDCADAIDSFAAVCCCYGVTVDRDGRPRGLRAARLRRPLLDGRPPQPAAGTSTRLRGQGDQVAAVVAGTHGPALGAVSRGG